MANSDHWADIRHIACFITEDPNVILEAPARSDDGRSPGLSAEEDDVQFVTFVNSIIARVSSDGADAAIRNLTRYDPQAVYEMMWKVSPAGTADSYEELYDYIMENPRRMHDIMNLVKHIYGSKWLPMQIRIRRMIGIILGGVPMLDETGEFYYTYDVDDIDDIDDDIEDDDW